MDISQVSNTKKMADISGAHNGPSNIPSKRAKVANLDRVEADPGTKEDTPPPDAALPVFLRKLRKAAVGTGCDIRLRVSVGGHPRPTLCWYHNEEELRAPSGEGDAGGLWIRDCKPGDAGLYTCVATNSLGEARSSALLAVMDLGEDSETTEDEATEPQVPMETKEGSGRQHDKSGRRVTSGEGGRVMDLGSDGVDRRATLPGGHDPIVERELMALGSRPPGPHDPSHAARTQIADSSPSPGCISSLASPQSSSLDPPRKNGVATHTSQDPALAGAVAKTRLPGTTLASEDRSNKRSLTQTSGGRDPSTSVENASSTITMKPKLARTAGTKIFDKVRVFEERRGSSVELPGGPGPGSASGQSWARFGRKASCDSDDSGQQMGGSVKEDGARQEASQRRSVFKQQRASSLEDQKSSYAQRVQSFQSKFTEELQRIKKLVGKPNLKKAFSTEQLPQKERLSMGKLEPIPPQVVRKLEERERALEQKREGRREDERVSPQSKEKVLDDQMEFPKQENVPESHKETERVSVVSGTPQAVGKISVSMETAPVYQLPGQPSLVEEQKSPTRETLQSSSRERTPFTAQKPASVTPLPRPQSPSSDLDQAQARRDPRMEHRSPSPTPQGRPLTTVNPSRPPRLTPSPTIPGSPLVKRRKSEAGRGSPALKLTIPTILLEDQPMEEEEEDGGKKDGWRRTETGKKKKRCIKNKRRSPRSPEEGDSDDSYMSADEGPVEAPEFERPLKDMTAQAGSEVILRCIITGSPLPTVTWKKSNVEIRSSMSMVVRAEGEVHSLVIRQMRSGDAGTYGVTAVNAAGKASCSATLYIKSEPTQVQCGKPISPLEVSSPIQSDEEYLSPLEEVMEAGPPSKHVTFREPLSFQVSLTNQVVTEGQEVTMTVKVRGQPKPVIYWLRDKVTLKTAGRFVIQETEDNGDSSTSEMKITSAQRSDAGPYICKISNEYGTKQCEARLEVKVHTVQMVLAITQQVRDVSVKAGESAMFECHMTGPQDVEVDWLANGKLIQPALLNCKMHFDGKRCRLLLNSVHEDDSGTYTCKLSTVKEELTSSGTLKVTPSREPMFTRKLDILEVIEGRTARFDCKVSGMPPPKVTWNHFENLVEESENVRILQEGGRHSLVIAHVTSDTEGFYTAIARNVHGKADCAAELYMQEPRQAISLHMAKLEKMPSIPEEPEVLESEVEKRTMPDFVKPLSDLEVIEGKEAVLRCKVAGLPYPTIAWYHNGKRIDSTEERKITQYRDVHSLVIRSVCHAHSGVYKSVISNKLGKAACYAHLYITDIVPDPPDGPPVVESITGKTITLSWKRPKRLDPSIDSSSLLYAVQQQALGSIQWTLIASNLRETSYTVSSLSKGVRYAFRVLTATSKVLSKPSPSTDLVQLMDRGPYLRKSPIIMDKPDIVYVVENQSVTITLTLNHVHAVVTWKRRGVVLLNKPGMYEMSMPDDDQHSLKIQRVRSADTGQLVITAANQFGSDLCTLQLAMAVPPKFETIMEDLDVHVGETSRFAVVVEGKPDPDILWYKDDVLLSESSHFTFVYDDAECSVVVLNARQEDSGVYTCTAKNLAGSISCKAELTVHTERKKVVEPVEDEATILRKMRRLTDYYNIHKEIGRGAFSYVKRVVQKKGKSEFAAKFISARAKRKASALGELSLLSDLDHQRILYFHDAFEKKNMVIIITELCQEELLERLSKKTSVMESEIRSCIHQVLDGLSYLHQKDIAHLDIKPENILMAESASDQIRLCDFGNATRLEASETHYCKYGTPEFVAPEIVNQTPVSKATDIWPVGVITYLCLTGVSPFAGENDRSTVLNIRSFNVAFEESMFSGLCRDAKGFVIKLLVSDSLRPTATECLRHPWFKSTNNKSIHTAMLKQVQCRRRWQRSLISYKSKMVMRTIPELLNDSSSHISIAVPRHLKEGSPPPSSSSDSDEDVDELPFIPMPLSMVFSGSRVSLNELPGDDDLSSAGRSNGTIEGAGLARKKDEEPIPAAINDGGSVRGRTRKRIPTREEEEEGASSEEEKMEAKTRKVPLKKGSSVETDKSESKSRRRTMRRGSSADSALLLHIEPEEGAVEADANPAGQKNLKKAVSMELPGRSPSPGTARLSQEDYALKLELMRQRLLRGGNADKKMSGLRGPLFETLGMDDEKQTSSLDRNLRRSRSGQAAGAPLTRAASSDGTLEDTPKTKVFRKSTSFTLGDSEPMPLHRRFGRPLEIPSAGQSSGTTGAAMKLQEATSMSAMTEQTKLESRPASPRGPPPSTLPGPERKDQQAGEETRPQETDRSQEDIAGDESTERGTKVTEQRRGSVREPQRAPSQERSPSVLAPIVVIEEEDHKEDHNDKKEIKTSQNDKKTSKGSPSGSAKERKTSAYADTMQAIVVPSGKRSDVHAPSGILTPSPSKPSDTPLSHEHPAVFAKVAIISERSPSVSSNVSSSSTAVPDRPTTPRQPLLRTDIKDIDSEEVFEARFKKRESSLTRGLRRLTRAKSEEKSSPVLGRKAGEGGEEVYRPGALGAPLEMVSVGLQEKSKSVQDLREVEKDPGLGLIGRFSMRAKRTSSVDKKEEKTKEEKIKEEKLKEVVEPSASKRRVTWAIGRSKSLDTKDLDSGQTIRQQEERDCRKVDDSSVSAMRRKFESKVASISSKIRTQSEERKERKEEKEKEKRKEQLGARLEEDTSKEQVEKDLKKISDSPVLAMRRKFENKMAVISTKMRSQSEERKGGEMEGGKMEGKKTPLFSRHRHSHSEGGGLRGIGIPENELAKQTGMEASRESVNSTTSNQSEKVASHTPEVDRRSRWDRWGLSRNKKDKTPSQTDLPSSATTEEESSRSQSSSRSTSDFPPVFHIKLRDHVLLEGDPVTLSCLPAGSPHPQITWLKDKRPLELDDRMNLISHPDGRQLLTIMKTGRRDGGLYECVATNTLATITSSCTLSLACVPKRPGTPEVPQTYNNTALVLWKPADTKAPCSYILERKTEGDTNWLIIATGVADCYYNVTDLPAGGVFRFRVACVNKAGQGPYSNCSDKVSLDDTVGVSSPTVAIVKTVPAPFAPNVSSSITTTPLKPIQMTPHYKTVSSISSSPTAFPLPPSTPPPSNSSSTLTETSPDTPTNVTTPTPPLSLPSPPTVKPPPPFVLPKPQSPVNVVPPMTQTPPTSPPPLVSPPPTPTKPVLASIPSYVPATTARVTPTPLAAPSFSPQVLQVSSLSPFGEGTSTPSRGTPSGRTTPSTSLRQGVPQKPYTFLDEKARGRFGVVRECRENSTGNIYMAKIVPYDQETKPFVLREYDILKSLHNDKIMALHEAYVTPRYLVLVAEYCTGKELLYCLIDRLRYSEDEVVCYLVQILQGLEFLHNRRILHLDLKPDNIMVTHLNVIKILDFGSAQNFNPLSLKQYNPGLGTLEYMAPEMVRGEVVGPTADIWSLGVLTYIMMSGRLPFQDKDPQHTEAKILAAKFDPTKLYPNISQSASTFIKKMLSSYAWARPTTKDCFTHAWLQDSYLMKLRRQTLTFTTAHLKEFLGEDERRRAESSTKHKGSMASRPNQSQSETSLHRVMEKQHC
ncbi:striated muscle preferentially expressed protein kinase isoform X2 [Osmerus mordax]|uniref:striated muscle preferentially expressed protein kinase isoform X2 n=1 Tax=Osmerus mordax TaxID=8014 RepID=UPI0035101354